MTKYQLITDAYESTLGRVTNTPTEWMRFMRSACRNYKCRFDEQILIYTQRPDATAVLEIEKWNKQFGRWVNKGATGIAVFDDEHNGNSRLKHYFDISDTHESRNARPVPIWQMNARYDAEVIEHLENSFGELEDTSTLAAALISAAKNAVDDNLTDYLNELKYCREDSFLEELDDFNVEVAYRTALQNSVAYMLLIRCGIDGESYFNFEDFQSIAEFNTRQTVNALGIATSDIAETCLREIAATVITLQKQERNINRTFASKEKIPHNDDTNKEQHERSFEYGTDISDGEQLSRTQPDSTGGTARNPWQVRIAPKEISETAPQDSVHQSADELHPQPTPDGDRADGQREDGTADRTDGGGTGRYGADESRESNAVGGVDEQHPAGGGGNDTERPDIRIKPLPTEYQQLTLMGEAEETAKAKSSAFSFSQQIIDEVLTSGGNKENSIHRIVYYFKKDHTTADNADFLKQEYGSGGKGFLFGGNHVAAWFNESGIHVAVGDTALNVADASVVTWEQAARRIRELLDMGRYAPQKEIDKADGLVLSELTSKLYFIYRDGVGKLPQEWTVNGSNFHQCVPVIAEHLCNPETLQLVINKLDGDWQIARSGALSDDFKWINYLHWHVPDALRGLKDLQRESLVFTADESVSTARPGFITQDEVDALLIGGANIEDSKFRVYSFFLQNHTAKEKSNFLKDEYGTGGSGTTEWHDSKGISFSRENNHMPYDKVILPWGKVAKRIDELIADGRYMSQRELDYIPEYEKEELAREVVSFYPYQSEDLPRQFPHGTDFWDSVKIVRPQLDEPERVAEILCQMAVMLDNTADFDRNYELMRRAFDHLTAYQNGTFSLFTPMKPAEKETAAPAPKAPELSAVPTDEAVQYDLQLGVSVYLGTDEYEIYSFDDTHVVLRDVKFPIFTQEMPRDKFDRKLRENHLNDGLIKTDEGVTEPQQEPDIDKDAELKDQIRDALDWRGYIVSDELIEVSLEEYDNRGGTGDYKEIADFIEYAYLTEEETPEFLVGKRYEIDGRQFIVDSVDEDADEIKLRDVTFENGVGFPIFRSEPLDFIRQYDPIEEKPQDLPAEKETQQTTSDEPVFKEIEGGLKSIVIDLPPYKPAEKEETLIPAWEQAKRRSRTQTFDPHPEIPMSERHNYRIIDDDLGVGGAKTKFRNNMEAIKTLQAIELENRFATPEEQEVLARYVGWGGLPQAFDPESTSWTNEFSELQATLSPDEYESARSSTLNAHYTM